MKNSANNKVPEDFMREEYDFEYSKGIVGKYARKAIESNGYIKLTPELQKIFKTSEDVNNALNAVIKAIPKTKRKASRLL
jgi:hypothetical protein